MQTVTLKAFVHRNQECIGIYFINTAVLSLAIRKIPGIKWSQTNKCWWLPLNKQSVSAITKAVDKNAAIETGNLKTYLQKRKDITATLAGPVKKTAPQKIPLSTAPVYQLGKENLAALEQFMQQLKLKAYSPSTIRTYRNEFLQLLKLLKATPVNNLTAADLKRYLVYTIEKEGISEHTAHSRLNALKFYFEQVLNREKFFWEIPRPKKQQQNPHFFNQDEITRIIKQTSNVKHKTMLMLAYATGMRVSEVTALKVWQIDSKRMQIIIERAKGKKDRITTLSPVLLVMLREYFTAYKPKKEGYLFCGQNADEPYSPRSLQLVLQAAKQRAGILKPGSVHALRHSFATHLLDKGTDVTMIMKLLGHNDIKTTLRYLHVTNRDVLQIISPLDHLNLGD
ncbi:tyrosine-type recombinase/integrase [Ferruginibacter sp.]|nr:site-specific integrase [Ferruginibacter sp.]